MATHTFTTTAPIRLDVELGAGSVDVTATDTTETTIRIEGPRADEFLVEQEGELITVLEPRSRRLISFDSGHRVTATVPDGSALRARTGSADVTATGRLRTAQAKSGSGQIRLAYVEEAAELATGSGEIRIERIDGDLTVKSGSGDVRLGTANGSVEVKSGSGGLRIEENNGEVTFKTGSGYLEILSTPRGRISSKGASGDVAVGIPSGTPVWTDLNTVSGSIRSGLAPVGEPTPGQDFVELRARTVSGDIDLVQV